MDQQTFKIWFTGFYEGEGTIVNDKGNRNKIRIGVYQNDPYPLQKAKELWGGTIVQRTRKSPASDKICTGHEWRLNHNDSLKFIEDIKPFMLVPYKIKQMEECLKICEEKWERNFKCNFCDNHYSDPSGVRRHELKEHINKGQEFKCSCGLKYKSKDSINRHIRLKKSDASSHTIVSDIPYNDGKSLRDLSTILSEKLEK